MELRVLLLTAELLSPNLDIPSVELRGPKIQSSAEHRDLKLRRWAERRDLRLRRSAEFRDANATLPQLKFKLKLAAQPPQLEIAHIAFNDLCYP